MEIGILFIVLPFTDVAFFIDIINVVKAFNTNDISDKRYLL